MAHDPSSESPAPDSPPPKRSIGFFEKYLTVWVIACIVLGVLIGQFLPAAPEFLSGLEYAQVSLPVAVLIWLMIYPMMLK
ncbi:MAG: arsenic resistance protein, partial [Spirochaetota bacterium]